MAVQKKQYTNNDIMKQLSVMDTRLMVVENWKNGIEIGKAAVAEYIQQQASDKTNKDRDGMYAAVKDLMPYVIGILVAGAALIYLYVGRTK